MSKRSAALRDVPQIAPERPLVFVIDPAASPCDTRGSGTAPLPGSGQVRSSRLRADSPAAIPSYSGPAITQSIGPAHLDLFLEDGPYLDITDILTLQVHR